MENVLEAVQRSWTRMVDVLFQPFHAMTWLGFTLAFLFADCGSAHSFNNSINTDTSSIPPLGDIEPVFAGIGVVMVVSIIAVVVVVMFAIWAFLLFLSSRATMVCIDGLQHGAPRVEALGLHGPAANALWRFRLALALASTVWVVGVVGLASVVLLGVGVGGPSPEIRIGFELGVALTIVAAVLLPAIVGSMADWLARDLAAPIMLVTGESVMGALGSLRSAERFMAADLVVYVLARILLALVIGMVTLPISLFCCCAFIIPGVRHAVFLPILVFQRSLGMQWIAGLDARFAALGEPQEAEAPA